jgi:hypothetical protein
MHRRLRIASALAVLAFVAAGCGSASTNSAAKVSDSSIPAGAAKVSAKVEVFATADSTFDGQWDAFTKLVDRFPIRGEAIDSIQQSLSEDGIDFDKDIKATLGPETDVAAWNVGAANSYVVGLTQPKDKAGFEAALKKGSDPSVYTEDGDWVLFSDTQAALDAFTALGGPTLDGDASFKDAFGRLSGSALGRIYVDGTQLTAAAQQKLQAKSGALGSLASGSDSKQKLVWGAASVKALADGFELDGVAKTEGLDVKNFDASFFDQVPSGAFFAAAFDGSATLTTELKSLERNPKLAPALGQAQGLLGISVDDIAQLVDGHGVLYARAGTPIPEVTLIVDGSDPKKSVATLDTLVAHLQALLQLRPQSVTVAGVTVKQVSVQGFTLLYGVVDGKLVVTTGQGGIVAAKGGAAKLSDDPTFKAAADAVGISTDETAGLVYVDIQNAVTSLSALAGAGGAQIPPDLQANIANARGFLLSAHDDGDGVVRVTAFLGVEPGPPVPAAHTTKTT